MQLVGLIIFSRSIGPESHNYYRLIKKINMKVYTVFINPKHHSEHVHINKEQNKTQLVGSILKCILFSQQNSPSSFQAPFK